MRLISFGPRGQELPGALVDDGRAIVPLTPILPELGAASAEMTAVVALLDELRPQLVEAAAAGDRVDADTVRLGPPVPRPSKVVVCGMNYQGQVEEALELTGGAPPRHPPLGLRPPTSLAGPFDPVILPPEALELDYEAELAVVIGRRGRRIPRGTALEHVAGYMCAQDLTARDVMTADMDLSPLYAQIVRAKSFDTFCPTGPSLVTADEVADPGALRVRAWVNGEPRQDASAGEMLVDVAGLVEWASASMTLLPGDILLTGTPAGMGASLDPPRFLRHGDVIRTEVTGVGVMENVVEDER